MCFLSYIAITITTSNNNNINNNNSNNNNNNNNNNNSNNELLNSRTPLKSNLNLVLHHLLNKCRFNRNDKFLLFQLYDLTTE